MIKIDTDFNLNVLLKLFFSLSKKIIFFSSILANNNLTLKIYCENIVIPFLFFPIFSSFFILHTRTAFLFLFFSLFFPLFFLLHTHALPLFFFYYFPLLQSITSSKLRTFQFSFFLLFFFFFPFFLSPFSLSTSFLPLLKIYPYSFLFFSFFPLFSLYSFLLFIFPRTFHRLIELSFSHIYIFLLSTSFVTPMQGIDFFFFLR